MRISDSNGGLAAVFEAVVNSMQSTHDNPPDRPATIILKIESEAHENLNGTTEFRTVAYEIIDNGPGFNRENLTSFLKTDSVLKAAAGGKGVGRLLWLKVFDEINIESTYAAEDARNSRAFRFTYEGVSNDDELSAIAGVDICTRVKLSKPNAQYTASLQKETERVAELVLAHILELFLKQNLPKIIVIDSTRDVTVDLRQVLSEDLCQAIKTENFKLKGHDLEVRHVLRKGRTNSKHEIILCAAGREIQSIRLDDHIKMLKSDSIKDGDKPLKYTALVGGHILNDLASQDRQGLLWQQAVGVGGEMPTSEEIAEEVARRSRAYLGERLAPLQEQQQTRIDSFLESNPYYRYLYKEYKDAFDHISPDLTDADLDVEFFRVEQRYGQAARQEMRSFLSSVEIAKTPEERSAELSKIISQINQVGQSRLARHVAYRRAVLSFLEQNLEQIDGAYPYESVLHDTLWPRRTDSNDSPGEKSNLWIVDDRFAFHAFVSSDQPVDAQAPRGSISDGRPDVAIFNRTMAFADDRNEVASVILLELKRPGRNDYVYGDEQKDPIRQVIRYAQQLKNLTALDARGAVLTVRQSVPLVAYIIADITPKLKDVIASHDCKPAVDGEGYYRYHETLNLYIEVIPFRKLLRDAKKRNQMLFHQLGLPADGW